MKISVKNLNNSMFVKNLKNLKFYIKVNPKAKSSSSGTPTTTTTLTGQGLPNLGTNAAAGGNLDFLRSNEQFQAMRALVQADPQILQPMLKELGKQNPQMARLIQEHQTEFLCLINEPILEGEEIFMKELAAAMPQVVFTPEEEQAIERLEEMGFDRATAWEVFIACNKNEKLAAKYLVDHGHYGKNSHLQL